MEENRGALDIVVDVFAVVAVGLGADVTEPDGPA
jgi:hypothetical protein